jgi:hypothetical protein
MTLLLYMCQIKTEDSYLIKLLEFSIPFILGLFASLLIDTLRNYIKNNKNRKFIKFYLENSILKNLPQLKSNYEFVKTKIETYDSHETTTILAHEDFNTKVLDSLSSPEYYSAFKERFILINEITSMITFLSQHLPSQINNDYMNYIDSHLKEENKVGDIDHVKNCGTCLQEREAVINILKNRIKEIEILTQKIKEVIK